MLWSSTVITWPVRPAERRIASSSSGLMVATLMTSAWIPSAASFFAASSVFQTGPPVVRRVTSCPGRSTSALPNWKR